MIKPCATWHGPSISCKHHIQQLGWFSEFCAEYSQSAGKLIKLTILNVEVLEFFEDCVGPSNQPKNVTNVTEVTNVKFVP